MAVLNKERPIYFYKKSFSSKGKVGIFASFVIFSFWILLLFLPFFEKVPEFIRSVSSFLCLFVGAFTLVRGLVLINAKGGWAIELTDRKFTCQVDAHKSPSFFGEDDSFEISLSEISHIFFESCVKYSADDCCVRRFTIHLKNGTTLALAEESGVDLDRLAIALSKQFVKIQRV